MVQRPSNLSLDEKHYDPSKVEGPIYALWEERDVFRAGQDENREAYTIVIPRRT